jgi:hypothetical protein
MDLARGVLMLSSRLFALVIGAVLLTATACGSSGSSGSSSGGGGATLKIGSPANDASVSEPFKLTFTSSEPIGPTDSGKDHVHLYVDGNTGSYQVITSSPTEVKNLSPGKHMLRLTLQHADHSPVGPEAQITVTVSGGTGGSSPTPSSGSSGGYGY